MKILAIIFGNLCVILFIVYYIKNLNDYKKAKLARENTAVKTLFDEIEKWGSVDFSELIIEREGVSFRTLYYDNGYVKHSFLNNGGLLRNKSMPRFISILLMQKFPLLADSSLYTFKKYRIYREDGAWDYGYSFTIKPKQRDLIYKLRRLSKA